MCLNRNYRNPREKYNDFIESVHNTVIPILVSNSVMVSLMLYYFTRNVFLALLGFIAVWIYPLIKNIRRGRKK